jgi:hypothetical protein
MTYYLYCVSSEYCDQHGVKKLGMTMYPIQRMHVYNTGDCPGIGLDKRYDAIWEVHATSREELFTIEQYVHRQFQSSRLTRANGNNTEWFRITKEDVAAVLESYIVRTLTMEEIEEIHTNATKCNDITAYEEEHAWKQRQPVLVIQPVQPEQQMPSLKDKFFSIFLQITFLAVFNLNYGIASNRSVKQIILNYTKELYNGQQELEKQSQCYFLLFLQKNIVCEMESYIEEFLSRPKMISFAQSHLHFIIYLHLALHYMMDLMVDYLNYQFLLLRMFLLWHVLIHYEMKVME